MPSSLFRLPTPRAISRLALVVTVSVWLCLVSNAAQVLQFARVPELAGTWRVLPFVVGGFFYQLTFLLLLLALPALLLPARAFKITVALLLVVGAAMGYYSNFLGIRFDQAMLRNLLDTHPAEAFELMSLRSVLWLLVVGVLPALGVLRLSIAPRAKLGWLRDALALIVLPVALTAALVYPQYQAYASARRNQSVHFSLPAPVSLLSATASYLNALRKAHLPHISVGTDARQRHPEPTPRVLVLVLGETARAHNQQLFGYPRATNPRMAQLPDLAIFPYTESCGTATAQSVPCIFSGLDRSEFSIEKAMRRDNLLDVLERAKVQTLWLDNDAGCKGVCERVPTVDFTYAPNPKHCSEPGNCHDGILLDALRERLPYITSDTLIVLHLKGSHGPAYYKRYPPEFEHFKPACQSNELTRCDAESLRNAYDNTLVYTDHILGEVVNLIKTQEPRLAGMLYYVSDHGESLGENGLYLHGLPYAVAPEYQTRVPMWAWFTSTFMRMEHWKPQCPREQGRRGRTHTDVYSTVLGLFEIDTDAYRIQHDLFAACENERQPPQTVRK